ncbi:ABC transporter permease [Vibrio sp. HA2012]|uniref:ABC transporter permease n=1 Tax=Vibrio sp. HA2012 TaxID=1971595 RepID=UPI000C2B6D9F|nr:FtsX-like permease family protein [Vibrio sp. HA2012]PJC86742.1 ABC transporter permease [Vibrio sp. HA2012]
MLVKLAWRNLWRNKLRTGIMLGAMVFGLMGIVVMMGFMSGMVDNMVHNAIAWQISHVQIHNKRYLENSDINATIVGSDVLMQKIADDPQVQVFSGRFLVDGMIGSARSNKGVRINGVDTDAEARLTPLADSIREGAWFSPQDKRPILISRKTADRLKLKPGSKAVLTFTNGDGDVTGAAFRVKGIFSSPSSNFDDSNVYVRIYDLKEVAGGQGVHEIALLMHENLKASDRHPLVCFQQQIASYTTDENMVRDWTQIQPLLASMLATMGVSSAIMLGIFMLAMGFGIINVMLMSVFERTREFGVLMAVGMQKHKVLQLIMLESLWLGICGATLGLLGCICVIRILQVTGLPLGSMAEGLGAYGVDTVLYPRVSAVEYLSIFITVTVSSLVAALYPARQILKQHPAEAMAEKH